jgi:hypothetical protein
MINGSTRLAVVIAFLVLPLSTILRWGHKDINEAIRGIPIYIFICICLMLLCYCVLKYDIILGAFGLYCVGNTLFYHSNTGLVHTANIVFGIVAVVVLRIIFVSATMRRIATIGLILLLAFEVVAVFSQFLNMPFLNYGLNKDFVHGTFGHHNFLGAFLAFVAPLMPWWLLPLPFIGILTSASLLSFVAAVGGLIVQIPNKIHRLIFLLCSACFIAFFFWNKSHDSAWSRIRIWKTALVDLDGSFLYLLIGRGLGSWLHLQLRDEVDPEQYFWQAHNEYLQLFIELGLVGLVFVIAFIVAHHNEFLTHGSLVAVLISASAIYVFHVPTLVGPLLVVVALFTKNTNQEAFENCDSLKLGSSSRYWV